MVTVGIISHQLWNGLVVNFKLVFRIDRSSRSLNTSIGTQFHQQSGPNNLIRFTDAHASEFWPKAHVWNKNY